MGNATDTNRANPEQEQEQEQEMGWVAGPTYNPQR